MGYEPKPGDATLFFNDKRGNAKAPDRKGHIIAHRDIKAGEKLELAMWEKEGRAGKPFLSGKIGDMREQRSGGREDDDEPPRGRGRDDDTSDIPF